MKKGILLINYYISKGWQRLICGISFLLISVFCFAEKKVPHGVLKDSVNQRNNVDIKGTLILTKDTTTITKDSLKIQLNDKGAIKSTMYGPPPVRPNNYLYTSPRFPGEIRGYQDIKNIPPPVLQTNIINAKGAFICLVVE